MAIEVKVPAVGESITEVVIADWLKAPGERVRQDEPLVTLETDKATLDLPAPASGVLVRLVKNQGEIAKVGEVIAYLDEAAVPADAPPPVTAPGSTKEGAPPPTPAAAPAEPRVMPAARRLIAERGVEVNQLTATGPGGRVLKEDVLRDLQAEQAAPVRQQPLAAPAAGPGTAAETPSAPRVAPTGARAGEVAPTGARAGEVAPKARDARREQAALKATSAREEEVVPMSMLRRRVGERLVQAQQSAALLTTFNEIDMSAVIALRRAHQDAFQQRYQVKLGFMSFFVKAVIEALKLVPGLNAEIRGTDIVYRNYYDIGIAVGGGRGLVVPVLRSAERLSLAEVERAIADFAQRAEANRLTLEDLQGGTFTISNGGVYGSLLSTPIVNPPQSGVLGLHVIQDRPVARDGQVAIRPMMYVALTYDHRIVDGREAVTFLRHVKGCVEEPARILLEV
jgi:2-oxoglutarate dehydrogenase E2 component (dihydrolipoamide succinyltransferase)